MRYGREIHVGSKMVFGPAREIAPDMQVAPTNGTDPSESWLLGFVEPNGVGGQSAHFYLLDRKGKETLVQKLTGGIVLGDISVPKP